MPIIDAHVHLYPPEVASDPAAWAAAQGERHWSVLCTRRRRDGRPVQSMPTIAELLRGMDQAGIARSLLLGWYWEKPETCWWQNAFYAECVRQHPDRLSACATLHPAAGFATVRDELIRARDAGLIGLGELSPHSQAYLMDDPVFLQALELAGAFHWPVNLHVTDPDARPFPGKIETPLVEFAALARRLPSTTFVLAHWGAMLPLRNPSVLSLSNLYYDTAASPLMYDAGVWRRFMAVVPGARILFGSDYPLNLYPRISIQAEMSRFLVEAKEGGATPDMLGGNVERIFLRKCQ